MKKNRPSRQKLLHTFPPLSAIFTAVKMSFCPIFIFPESLRSLSEDTESHRGGETFHLFIVAISP